MGEMVPEDLNPHPISQRDKAFFFPENYEISNCIFALSKVQLCLLSSLNFKITQYVNQFLKFNNNTPRHVLFKRFLVSIVCGLESCPQNSHLHPW